MRCIRVKVISDGEIVAEYNQNAVKPLPQKKEIIILDGLAFRIRNVIHSIDNPGGHCESRIIYILAFAMSSTASVIAEITDLECEIECAEELGFELEVTDVEPTKVKVDESMETIVSDPTTEKE